jgi:SAM-dependent methyltransferase
MSADLEYSSGSAGQAVANDYDSFAEAYAAETESNLLNGYYVRPAVLHQAGLGGDPLPFPDGAFDDVVACLVLSSMSVA